MKKILERFSHYYIIFCIYAFIGWVYEVFWMWFIVPPKHFVNRGVLLGPFLPIYGFGVLILLLCLKKFMKKKHTLENPIYFLTSIITITSFIYITIIEFTTPKIYHVDTFFKNYGVGLIITNVVILIISYLILKFANNKKLKELDVTIILVFLSIWVLTTLLEYVSHFVMDEYFNKELWNYSKDFLNINKRVNWDASRNFAIGGLVALYLIQPFVDKLLNKLNRNKKLVISLLIGIPMILDYILHVVLKLI